MWWFINMSINLSNIAYVKMENTIIKFGDIEIEKLKFHQHKRPISIKNIDINKIVVSNKVSFG